MESSGENEFDSFCRSLIPKLMRLAAKSPESANRAQMDILRILYDAEHTIYT